MRAILMGLLLAAALLAGCSDGDAEAPGSGGRDGATDSEAEMVWQPLRFVGENRSVVEETITVEVSPQDACIPASCAAYSAGTSGDPAFVKFIDVSPFLPVGMHAFLEVDATWEKENPVVLLGRMSLGWWSFDSTWVTDDVSSEAEGEAHWEGHVSNYGPEPVQMILIVLEPEGLHETVEVEVQVRVTPFDDAVVPTHVVAVSLGGGAVPIRLDDGGGGTRLHVRGPDDGHVLTEQVAAGEEVRLPASSPSGQYLLTAFGDGGPVRLSVPAANLTDPLLRLVDIAPIPGERRALPSGEEVSWTVDLAATPYWVAVALDALDGRSTTVVDARLTVIAPDGTELVEGLYNCQGCLYSLSWFGGDLADSAYTPGAYTFTVSTEAAQGWEVYEMVSLYGRPAR